MSRIIFAYYFAAYDMLTDDGIISFRKVGGIYFWRILSIGGSFYVKRKENKGTQGKLTAVNSNGDIARMSVNNVY